ncbi:type II toxin-antitoxin system RelE/ParE family toxin [Salinisphaera orenii]|uniref:type II toxin-antitoxin system RelE/ParE family toxin n=1 Tax=Salinisphaera orenii TaxID=856731 RepID=UPI000F4833A0
MSYSVYVRGAAERDVAEAQRWYEQQQAGLAAEFNAEFGSTLDRLADTPFLYPQRYREIRRAVLRRFPFLVWYRVEGAKITVLACTHGKANPSELPSRLR